MERFLGTQNMRDQLAEGATDGSYKKVVRDRGGVVEDTTFRQREDMADVWYGIHETPVKELGDGTAARTPNYRETANWRLM